jgi:hypothetical protein
MTTTEQTPSGNAPIDSIIANAKQVITDPASFFAGMPKSGGFAEPVMFVAAMAVATGLVGIVLALLGLGGAPTFGAAVLAAILLPVFGTIFSFVGAAILFVVWKVIGSGENYETAYRCGAYMTAISPITTLLGVIPMLGALIALGWALYLAVQASERVHGIAAQKAWLAFGIVFGLMGLMSISAERTARQLEDRMQTMTDQLEGVEDMSPEEAGRAVGDFLKGLQKSVDESDKAEQADE